MEKGIWNSQNSCKFLGKRIFISRFFSSQRINWTPWVLNTSLQSARLLSFCYMIGVASKFVVKISPPGFKQPYSFNLNRICRPLLRNSWGFSWLQMTWSRLWMKRPPFSTRMSWVLCVNNVTKCQVTTFGGCYLSITSMKRLSGT